MQRAIRSALSKWSWYDAVRLVGVWASIGMILFSLLANLPLLLSDTPHVSSKDLEAAAALAEHNARIKNMEADVAIIQAQMLVMIERMAAATTRLNFQAEQQAAQMRLLYSALSGLAVLVVKEGFLVLRLFNRPEDPPLPRRRRAASRRT